MWRLGPLLIATVLAAALGAITGALIGLIGGWLLGLAFDVEVGFYRAWLIAGAVLALAMWVPWVIGIVRHKGI